MGKGVFAARIDTPGAVMSGFIMSCPIVLGPRDEKAAMIGAGAYAFSPPLILAEAPAPEELM